MSPAIAILFSSSDLSCVVSSIYLTLYSHTFSVYVDLTGRPLIRSGLDCREISRHISGDRSITACYLYGSCDIAAV